MGVALSCCASFACSCRIGATCSCCGYLLQINKSYTTRLMYAVIFMAYMILAWAFSNWGYDMLHDIPWVGGWICPTKETCGVEAVYRISFSLALFHAIFALLFIGVNSSRDVRAIIQDGWWWAKIPALVLLTIGVFFIPDIDFFWMIYGWVALVGAALFILVQLALLIDFAHAWAEDWVSKYEEDTEAHKAWLYMLIAATFIINSGTLGISGVALGMFSSADCWYSPVVVSVNLVIGIIILLVSLLPKVQETNPRIGLLQSSVVVFYSTYLVWSAILSEPNSCPGWFSKDIGTADPLTIIIGAIITVVSVLYASLRAGSSTTLAPVNEVLLEQEIKEDEKHSEDDNSDDESDTVKEPRRSIPDDEVGQVKYNYSFFHLAFCLGAMYVAMLVTNWAVLEGDSDSIFTDVGWASFGIKLATAGVTFALYLWTILAPCIFPDRDFS